MYIIGAGLSGCIAGFIFPNATIYERNTEFTNNHQGLLRFRTNKISELTGIPFTKVEINKYIWSNRDFRQPNPNLINLYSQKVTGRISDRSISNLTGGTRYIAPIDFHNQLQKKLQKSIEYGVSADLHSMDRKIPIITTAPLNKTLEQLDKSPISFGFNHSTINIKKYIIPGCDIFQTIYFPDMETDIYRASITGDMLIIESIGPIDDRDVDLVSELFAVDGLNLIENYSGTQKLGKIIPLENNLRKNILYKLSHFYNIWSLGRYACWRNILLDDVLEDAYHIRRMISQHIYDVRKDLKNES
jgi:hypothetical protein